jgi:hypothetical protein
LVATPASAPVSLRATGGNGKVTLTWKRPSLNGGTFLSYSVFRVNDSEPDTTTSARFTSTGLADGKRYTFQVRTVTRGSNGKTLIGATATVSATTLGGVNPDITISKGTKYTGSDPCDNVDRCYNIHIVATGLKPNTSYSFSGYTSGYGRLHTDNVTTTASGRINIQKFYNDDDGSQVWVTAIVNGKTIKSNEVTW